MAFQVSRPSRRPVPGGTSGQETPRYAFRAARCAGHRPNMTSAATGGAGLPFAKLLCTARALHFRVVTGIVFGGLKAWRRAATVDARWPKVLRSADARAPSEYSGLSRLTMSATARGLLPGSVPQCLGAKLSKASHPSIRRVSRDARHRSEHAPASRLSSRSSPRIRALSPPAKSGYGEI
jgi:hypothetical protein